jgi:hypothetical protein
LRQRKGIPRVAEIYIASREIQPKAIQKRSPGFDPIVIWGGRSKLSSRGDEVNCSQFPGSKHDKIVVLFESELLKRRGAKLSKSVNQQRQRVEEQVEAVELY